MGIIPDARDQAHPEWKRRKASSRAGHHCHRSYFYHSLSVVVPYTIFVTLEHPSRETKQENIEACSP